MGSIRFGDKERNVFLKPTLNIKSRPIKGQAITNPTNEDSYEILETTKDTGGERITIKAVIKGKGKLVPNHLHILQDETFDVISGQLTFFF